MASWMLIRKDGKRLEDSRIFVSGEPLAEPPVDCVWSLHEYYYNPPVNLPTATRFSYKTASGFGSVNVSDKGNHYEIEVVGEKIEDIRIVRARLEKEIGVKVLNPVLELPSDLETSIERIKYLVGWIAAPSKKKKKTEPVNEIQEIVFQEFWEGEIKVLAFSSKTDLEKAIRTAMEIVKITMRGVEFRYGDLDTTILSNTKYEEACDSIHEQFRIRHPLEDKINQIVTSLKKK